MSTRWRFSGEFKAKVALEALRGEVGDNDRSETVSSKCQSSMNVLGLNPVLPPLGQARVE